MTLHMTTLSSTHRSHPLLTVSTLLAALGCILLTACSPSMSANNGPDADAPPRRAELAGTTVCLPHRDTSGPQTMECAFGIRTDDGVHYALDLSVLQTDVLFDFPTHERVVLEGSLVPLDDIDERTWKTYDIAGQLRVASVRIEA